MWCVWCVCGEGKGEWDGWVVYLSFLPWSVGVFGGGLSEMSARPPHCRSHAWGWQQHRAVRGDVVCVSEEVGLCARFSPTNHNASLGKKRARIRSTLARRTKSTPSIMTLTLRQCAFATANQQIEVV